jgi:CBS-domain-containing membrane protein
MQARDIMTSPVVSISPQAKISEAIGVMLRSHLSGLPVIDAEGRLVGILSEGDLLRRAELGTETHRPRWIDTFLAPGRSASEYVHTHGRIIEEVMTQTPLSIEEETPLEEIVSIMQRKRIKRLPVLRQGALVGIVTRADLLRALSARSEVKEPEAGDDKRIKAALEADLKSQSWMPGSSITIRVENGVVELSGIILDDRYRDAIRVCAENIAGVKGVRDRIVFVEPFTGAYVDPSEKQG